MKPTQFRLSHTQLGFIQLTLMGWIAVAAGALILFLSIAVKVQTVRLESVKAEYATFKAQVKAVGDEQERKTKLKEAQYADQIKGAVTERDAALAKLRHERAGRRELSRTAEAPAGSGQVCFSTTAYNTALGRYRERLERGLGGIQPLAIEGDAAQIDAQTLLKGWPQK